MNQWQDEAGVSASPRSGANGRAAREPHADPGPSPRATPDELELSADDLRELDALLAELAGSDPEGPPFEAGPEALEIGRRGPRPVRRPPVRAPHPGKGPRPWPRPGGWIRPSPSPGLVTGPADVTVFNEPLVLDAGPWERRRGCVVVLNVIV